MLQYSVVKINERADLKSKAAQWFSEKWRIPEKAYLESMNESMTAKSAVPRWYVALDGDEIIAGAGVIYNDFHERKDLSPNVCAVYVEKEYRCRGVAGKLLSSVCEDMKSEGINTLYLLTDHTSFYERYGWEFLCMVMGDAGPGMSRMYIHRS